MSEHFGEEISGGPRERETPERGEPRERPARRVKAVAWSTLGLLGVAAAAAGVYAATLGGGPSASPTAQVGAAASPDPSPSASATPPGHDKSGRPGNRPRPLGGLGGLGGLGLRGDVLHGEATVKTKDGGTQIIDAQTGTISALDGSAGTLTVTSSDNAAFSYVVDTKTRIIDFAASAPAKATLADLKVGDTVRVAATRAGDTRTASAVVDGVPKRPAMPTARPSGAPTARPSMLRGAGKGWGGGWGGGFGHGPHPVPLATPSATPASA